MRRLECCSLGRLSCSGSRSCALSRLTLLAIKFCRAATSFTPRSCMRRLESLELGCISVVLMAFSFSARISCELFPPPSALVSITCSGPVANGSRRLLRRRRDRMQKKIASASSNAANMSDPRTIPTFAPVERPPAPLVVETMGVLTDGVGPDGTMPAVGALILEVPVVPIDVTGGFEDSGAGTRSPPFCERKGCMTSIGTAESITSGTALPSCPAPWISPDEGAVPLSPVSDPVVGALTVSPRFILK